MVEGHSVVFRIYIAFLYTLEQSRNEIYAKPPLSKKMLFQGVKIIGALISFFSFIGTLHRSNKKPGVSFAPC